MESNIFLLLGVCAMMCIQCNFPTANALMGPTVRLAHMHEFPFVVSVAYRSTTNRANLEDHLCTAALITKNHALSSAACIYGRSIMTTVILYGSNALTFTSAYDIQWWIKFNEWSSYTQRSLEFSENDIAVIKLTEPIRANFEPAKLTDLSMNDLLNRDVTLAGWSISRRRVVTPHMLTTVTTIISNNDCENRISRLAGRRIGIHSRYFCTFGTPQVQLQNGDYGGPVIYLNKIVAVNKETMPKLGNEIHPNKVNIHSSIHYYREFITAVTDDNFVMY